MTSPLINAVTGAPGVAFPHTRLRSGTIPASNKPLSPNGTLSEKLETGTHVFVAAFYKVTIPQFLQIVNPDGKPAHDSLP
jgi:hypothetical protein